MVVIAQWTVGACLYIACAGYTFRAVERHEELEPLCVAAAMLWPLAWGLAIGYQIIRWPFGLLWNLSECKEPRLPTAKVRTIKRSLLRLLQLVTNVHRIHHDRWSYGYTFRPLPWGYFPPFRTGSRREPGELRHYGWKRIKRSQFHDCTLTGRY